MEITYKPSWKSFYKDFMLMLLLVILAGAVNYFKAGEWWLKWLWIAVCAVDVLLFIYAALKRSMMSLILRDDPDNSANRDRKSVV